MVTASNLAMEVKVVLLVVNRAIVKVVMAATKVSTPLHLHIFYRSQLPRRRRLWWWLSCGWLSARLWPARGKWQSGWLRPRVLIDHFLQVYFLHDRSTTLTLAVVPDLPSCLGHRLFHLCTLLVRGSSRVYYSFSSSFSITCTFMMKYIHSYGS